MESRPANFLSLRSAKTSPRHESRGWVGAILSAGLASTCCILPLGLGALGFSGTVVAAFFEPLRPYFLAAAGVLLALGFYLSFRSVQSSEACATESQRVVRLAKPTLWVSTVAVLALALFPTFAGIASNHPDRLPVEPPSQVVVLEVSGMTCESCAPGIRSELLGVPGVLDAAVDYERKIAEIRVRSEDAPELHLLIEAVERAGFRAAPGEDG